MELDFNLVILIVLIILAIIDLTVGVANDAVNFLSAAVGSKAGTLRTILIVASIGVMFGVLFSGGMMKIARSGIFDPSFFLMPELLIIFVAAMLQDILLLDTYNTFGLPTSTTVSVVFGLFGGALGLSIVKLAQNAIPGATLMDYMNFDDVAKIIIGIFLSVAVAFIVGFLIQFLTRLIFTFRYKERFNRLGGIWGAIALSSISLFIIIKGLKNVDSSILPADTMAYMQNNLGEVGLYLILGWFVILQPLISFTKVNVLKIIVMAGTFSLGMAFAANDLVNFIGAPLAALNTYELAQNYGEFAETTLMSDLAAKSQANKLYVIIAGLIMMITLFVSKKARSVTATTIGLSSQETGNEQFKSNMIGRFLVRRTLTLTNYLDKAISKDSAIRKNYKKSFDLTTKDDLIEKLKDKPAFDLIRAAVILMVSAGLISVATTLTLPLSTTYVTFIVAMAAALPDRAWGRETAAYRVSGVINVIGGWFGTALIAMMVAGIISVTIYFGGLIALIFFVVLTAAVLISSSLRHRRKAKDDARKDSAVTSRTSLVANAKTDPLPLLSCRYIYEAEKLIDDMTEALGEFDINLARNSQKGASELASELSDISSICYKRIHKENLNLRESEIGIDDTASHNNSSESVYIRIIASAKHINDILGLTIQKISSHISNSHGALDKNKISRLYDTQKSVSIFMKQIGDSLREDTDLNAKDFTPRKKELVLLVSDLQSEAIKLGISGFSRRTIDLYMDLLSTYKIMVEESYQLLKDISKVADKNND